MHRLGSSHRGQLVPMRSQWQAAPVNPLLKSHRRALPPNLATHLAGIADSGLDHRTAFGQQVRKLRTAP